MGFFDYVDQHPDFGAAFQRAMTSDVAAATTAIAETYDFSGIGFLVDIGGGHGLQLVSILRAHPTMRGVLFDLPEVVANAAATLEESDMAKRCQIVGGDFFESVPPGGDVYLLRQIIHDWDDARAGSILKSCRRAVRESGRLLVVERRLTTDSRQAWSNLETDMEMLVNTGGRERTDAEYQSLFTAAGFRLAAVVPLGDESGYHVFEGVPV